MEELIAVRIGRPLISLIGRLVGFLPSSGGDIYADLSEIADKLGQRWAEKNRLRRKLADAADTVADQLSEFIAVEFASTPRNDVEAAVLAVGDCLSDFVPKDGDALIPLVGGRRCISHSAA